MDSRIDDLPTERIAALRTECDAHKARMVELKQLQTEQWATGAHAPRRISDEITVEWKAQQARIDEYRALREVFADAGEQLIPALVAEIERLRAERAPLTLAWLEYAEALADTVYASDHNIPGGPDGAYARLQDAKRTLVAMGVEHPDITSP